MGVNVACYLPIKDKRVMFAQLFVFTLTIMKAAFIVYCFSSNHTL